jgi:hypothetical protein
MKKWEAFLGLVLSALILMLTMNRFYLSPVKSTAMKSNVALKTRSKWGYYPEEVFPRYGIVMAATSDKFIGRTSVENLVSPCIAELYARKFQYAFVSVKYLERVSNRSYGPCNGFSQWNKILLLKRYIEDVDVILWIDMDAVITQFNTPLHRMLPDTMPQSPCNTYSDLTELGSGLPPNLSVHDLPGATAEPFLWASRDMFPSYALNLNTAVLAVRRGQLGRAFLDEVWRIGQDSPEGFKRHDSQWNRKPLCRGYYGWPWEQGAIWDVLTNSTHAVMRRATCMLPFSGPTALNSIQDHWKDAAVDVSSRPFITHKLDVPMSKFMLSFVNSFGIDLTTIEDVCDVSVARLFS